jgi:predicted thioredoxin/glutaredoxin
MGWAWLLPWRREPGRRLENLEMTVFTRHGCHLCDAAWEELRQRQRRYGFGLKAVDVDSDAQLVKEYGTCVPVVVVNGRVRFRGVVNPVLLDRLLRGESQRSR